jgi:hypothetical protein
MARRYAGTPVRLQNWIVMQNNSLAESWFINDFHRKNSMAAQREVQQMSLHPCSREQKLAQIQRIKEHSATTKESANLERSKKQ